MIRYATIGSSWITDAFIGGCKRHGEAQLAAVYSRDAARGREFAAKHGGAAVYTDLSALAADNTIDAVYIASPNALHYAQSKMMLQAGKHVICEKPITVEPEKLSELAAFAEERGLVYMEALMGRHLPARERLFAVLPTLGKIAHARLDFSQRSSKYDRLLKGEQFSVFDPAMAGGALMDLGVYCAYLCVDLFGMPQTVAAYTSPLSTGADGSGGAVLGYDSFFVTLTYSKAGQSVAGSEIIGDAGTLLIPSVSTLQNMTAHYADGRVEPLSGDMDKAELMSYESADFCRYITHFDETRDERRAVTRLAEEVSRLMKEIRKQAGISLWDKA